MRSLAAVARSDPAADADDRHAVFAVTASLTGRAWRPRPHDRRIAEAIAARHDLPELIGRVLAARGVGIDEVPRFLAPTLRDTMPDPSTLTDMDAAAERIAHAVGAGETVAILADYDVDGATSGALLARYLRHFGLAPLVHVPDRLAEGYGPSRAALARFAEAGASLVITVDCGAGAGDAFAALAGRADAVVLDHHAPGPELPAVAALVNPNREDDVSGLGHLAAVGIVFLTLAAVSRTLRARGAFAGRPEPDLLSLLGLVALGTVCDVVPLVGLNRTMVAQGLKVLARRDLAGLTALADAARLHEPPGTYHLGFLMGPRINAGGRIGRSDLGLRLLTTEDRGEAEAIAAELEALNAERQAIEAAATAEAVATVETRLAAGRARDVLVVAGHDWHPGIIGLIAARLKERFARPALVIALGADGRGRGSARSVAGADIGRAVRDALAAGIVAKGGGHAMAAGLEVAEGRVGELERFLDEALSDDVRTARQGDFLAIDGPLTAGGANARLMALIDRAGPYGAGHSAPRFAFGAHRVGFAGVVGERHVRASLIASDRSRIEAIAFRAAGTAIGDALMARGAPSLHVAGRLKLNRWQGRTSVELLVDDIARPA